MPTADKESTTAPDSKNASRDAPLIELGKRAQEIEAWFDAQEGVERPDTDGDPEYVEAMDQHGDVLTKMVSLPAHTIDGLRAKAERLIHWCKGFNFDTETMDTDGIVGLSIARDLLRNDAVSSDK